MSYARLREVINMMDDGLIKIQSALEELPPVYGEKPPKQLSAKFKSIESKRFDDDYDAIYEAYTNPKARTKLSLTQQKQLARWKFARQWMSEFDPPTESETVQAIRNEFGVSQRQAYTDVANAKRFFASMDRVNEEFDRIMAVERILRLRNRALERGDAKSLDVAAKCDITLIKLRGWDREKAHMPEPRIIEVLVTTDLEVLGIAPVENKALAIQSFWKKKEEAKQRDIQDVDFTELLDKPRNEREHARQ